MGPYLHSPSPHYRSLQTISVLYTSVVGQSFLLLVPSPPSQPPPALLELPLRPDPAPCRSSLHSSRWLAPGQRWAGDRAATGEPGSGGASGRATLAYSSPLRRGLAAQPPLRACAVAASKPGSEDGASPSTGTRSSGPSARLSPRPGTSIPGPQNSRPPRSGSLSPFCRPN